MNNDDFWPEPVDDFEPTPNELDEKSVSCSALEILPRELLKRSIDRETLTDIASKPALCLIVETSSQNLVHPVEQALDELGAWDYSVVRSTKKASRPDDFSDRNILAALASGQRIYGVAPRLEYLPQLMLTGADIRVCLQAISTDVVAEVIRQMTGSQVEVPSAVERLSFDEVIACLRQGDSAEVCLARLERTIASTRVITPIPSNVPLVENLSGYGAVKTWAVEVMADIAAWRRGEIAFEDIDRAIVMASSPGLGKTTFARSFAKSCRLPLIATSVAAWFANSPGYLDSVIKQIDEVFAAARAAAPSVLFLDELDAVPSRIGLSGRYSAWWSPVITHLLTVLDGAISDASNELVIIGATNFPERLDPALVRPGRLNRVVRIDPPNAEALIGIFRHHLGGDLGGEDLTFAADLAVGSTGADVAGWVRAARRRARTACRDMTIQDLLDFIAPRDERPAALVERAAFHEAGHAVCAHLLRLGSVSSISIIPRGCMDGFTSIERRHVVMTAKDIETEVMQQLAGRAAEEILAGDPGVGAGGVERSDLAHATRTLGVARLGMGLGSDLRFRGDADNVISILAADKQAADMVEADLRRVYQDTIDLLRANLGLVRAVADALLTRRRLNKDTFLDVVERYRTSQSRNAPSSGSPKVRNAAPSE